jgi:multiple sugar transport system permease protein
LSFKRAATYLTLSIWSFICVLPLYWVFIASLKPEDAIIHGPRYLPFVDFAPASEAWRFILFDSSENLLRPLLNSFIISATATLIVITSTCLLLYAITRLGKTQPWLLTLMLATRILPPVTVVIALYMMAQKTGLLDTRTALTLTYSAINLPVAIWLLLPVFGKRATEQEEAALLEGVSHLYILWDVLRPMIMTSIAAVALIVFVLGWNEYLFAAILTTDHASTLTPWMVGQLSIKEAQVGGEPEEWAHLSAATVLMVTPLLLFTSVAMRMLSKRAITK